MKKILFIIVLNLSGCVIFAQTPYHNMEKYWWYRYRLVNDFMYIGDSMGMSIPAQVRDYPNGS